ncbi:MAG: hypothetical protein KGL56_03660, partial [Alphaproteobacteria bacterium]|nr:hypothetical protein [Alphaproteobacteria bacterium]
RRLARDIKAASRFLPQLPKNIARLLNRHARITTYSISPYLRTVGCRHEHGALSHPFLKNPIQVAGGVCPKRREKCFLQQN